MSQTLEILIKRLEYQSNVLNINQTPGICFKRLEYAPNAWNINQTLEISIIHAQDEIFVCKMILARRKLRKMNKFLIKRALTTILIASVLLTPTVYGKPQVFADFSQSGNVLVFESFLRTELFFGTAKADGSVVSEDEWKKFLADEVTPRFPNGFTVIAGDGQFRNDAGEIIREKSFVLIILYPLKTRRSDRRKIEEIRKAYVRAFQQQSVMRVDFPHVVQVSF